MDWYDYHYIYKVYEAPNLIWDLSFMGKFRCLEVIIDTFTVLF
jgi:hypothetical protein